MVSDFWRLMSVTGPAFGLVWILWLRERRAVHQSRHELFFSLSCCGLPLVGLWWFLRLGRTQWTEPDWHIFYWCYRSLQETIRNGQIPYYIIDSYQYVDRYWASLQAPLGPDIWLLRFLSIGTFYMVHTTLVFAAGA